MVKLIRQGVYYTEGRLVKEAHAFMTSDKKERAVKNTVTYGILHTHGAEVGTTLRLKADAIVSSNATYVGVIQIAKASGLAEFPVPYILTNDHNSLCAADETMSADVRAFGLSAAKKYGGDFVPANLADMHQYMRECVADCGSFILGSDLHTRYGALGTLAVCEDGPALVKQLLEQTYDIAYPETVAVHLRGKLRRGVGPQDVALSIIGATYGSGLLKNKILEFVGTAISGVPMDYRNAIDAMMAATGCLSTIWETDERTEEYLCEHGRAKAYKKLTAAQPAYYDLGLVVDLSRIEPMIALPFHPSDIYTLREFLERPAEIIAKVEEEGKKRNSNFHIADSVQDGKVYISQGIIAGCTGGLYENIAEAAEILRDKSTGEFTLNIYPASQPVYKGLAKKGYLSALIRSGAVVHKTPFIGAEEASVFDGLSIRYASDNLWGCEGGVAADGKFVAFMLMDARSIAATAANGGVLTSALDYEYNKRVKKYCFNSTIYANSVYRGVGNPSKDTELVCGANIVDLPEQLPMGKHILMKVVSKLTDAVTTTEELLPSREVASYRSNPETLASFALCYRDPEYVARATDVRADELHRRETGKLPEGVQKWLGGIEIPAGTGYGSVIVANKHGDCAARDEAAFCQRVLGGVANICKEYIGEHYRTSLINWGMIPFTCEKPDFKVGEYIFIDGIAEAIERGDERVVAKVISMKKTRDIVLTLGTLSDEEKRILLDGCLINTNRRGR